MCSRVQNLSWIILTELQNIVEKKISYEESIDIINDALKEFIDCLNKYVNNKYKYDFVIKTNNISYDELDSYYKYILTLINNHNMYYDMFNNRLTFNDNDKYFIEIYNIQEENLINIRKECEWQP